MGGIFPSEVVSLVRQGEKRFYVDKETLKCCFKKAKLLSIFAVDTVSTGAREPIQIINPNMTTFPGPSAPKGLFEGGHHFTSGSRWRNLP